MVDSRTAPAGTVTARSAGRWAVRAHRLSPPGHRPAKHRDPGRIGRARRREAQEDAGGGDGTVQLPPEILIDRHLVRAERLLGDGDPVAALEAMTEILALQEEHDLVLQDDFNFQYAQVAYAAGRPETAIASLNQYLATGGREGPSSTARRWSCSIPPRYGSRGRRGSGARPRWNGDAPKRNGDAPPAGLPGTCSGTARRAPRWWCCRGALWPWAATRSPSESTGRSPPRPAAARPAPVTTFTVTASARISTAFGITPGVTPAFRRRIAILLRA